MIINQIKLKSDKEEDLQRILPGFPISVYQTDFSHLNYQRVNWHWHDDFQICLVTKGSVLFHVVSKTWKVSAGTGIFINKKLAHNAEPDIKGSAYYCIDFHPDLICPSQYNSLKEKVLSSFESEETSSCFLFDTVQQGGRMIVDTIHDIIDISENQNMVGWELIIHSEILKLWPAILIMSQGNGTRINFQSNQRIQKMITYLNDHYNEKVSLSDLSQVAFLCPEECTRFFKKITGKTIFQYLMQYRVEKSQKLLCQTDMSIAEIATHTGFSTQSYFSVCFQKQTGLTPSHYRKNTSFLASDMEATIGIK